MTIACGRRRGLRGSPGGPKAIAQLVLIIAQDLQQRGVDSGAAAAAATATTPTAVAVVTPGAAAAAGGGRGQGKGRGRGGGGRGGGRGRAAFVAAAAAQTPGTPPTVAAVPVADIPGSDSTAAERETTAIECAADPADLAIIRELFRVWLAGADPHVDALLGFDAYFPWYYPLKRRMPFRAPLQQRRERALDNCRRAIDMQEIVERLSIQHH
eukprot:1605791-Prymnesium_polylepis.3